MSELLNPKVVEDLATNIRAAKRRVVNNHAAATINSPYGQNGALTEWDFDIPKDNRFHDPFSHFRQPEPLWTRLQDKCTNDEEAVRLVCVLRDLLLLVDNRRHASATDFIRRAKYEEALQIIFGLRINTSEPYHG